MWKLSSFVLCKGRFLLLQATGIRTKLPAKCIITSYCVKCGLGTAGHVCMSGGGSVPSLWEP